LGSLGVWTQILKEATKSKLIAPRKTRPSESPVGTDLTQVCSRDTALAILRIVTTPMESG